MVRLRLDFDRAFCTGRLVGWNLGRGTLFAPEGDPKAAEWRTPERVAAIAQLKKIRAPYIRPWMRFSGLQIDGSFGNDGYHFEQPGENMAPEQYLHLMAEADAEPIITLNFATGTASEAARYAAYVAKHGVTRFEIGNECYGSWNTGYWEDSEYSYARSDAPEEKWRGRPSADAISFAGRALEYVETVVREVPEAKFFVPLTQASMDAWGGIQTACGAMAPLFLHPAVDAAVVHQYHVDEAMMFGLADKNDPAFITAGSERYQREYEQLQDVLRPYGVGIAVTEYHVAGAFARGQFRVGSAPIMGLGIADMLIGYAQLGIEHLCQHMSLEFKRRDDPDRDILVEPWYVPAFEHDGVMRPRPSTIVTGLFADSLRPTTVPVQIEDSGTVEVRLSGEVIAAPARHAVAFQDGEDVTLVVLNRLDATPIEVEGMAVRSSKTYAPTDLFADDAIDAVREADTDVLAARSVTALTLSRH